MTIKAQTDSDQRVCSWCSQPATREATIEREDIKRDGTIRRAGIVAPTCAEHGEMVDRQWLRADLEAGLRRETAALRRTAAHTSNHAAHAAAVKRIERELEAVR